MPLDYDTFIASLQTVVNCAKLSLVETDAAEWEAVHNVEAVLKIEDTRRRQLMALIDEALK